mmetsp:Transcript_247/g.514  ORF Transcript_247/g.514 Transcript_247/m.514 type:complete len:128 (-) Transcript_247:566-949(-)|eukprot:CAMPEP_0196653680 /NCGR_PEP_ID=MMETSP1086-20130531/3325_1 /TAXON_ID=77921 /ORGANISM="Cyanoptyche  gloeocystis , Strain SAG4.97" /LENGTH=127 /DNA_ID=CAMNT_0041984995 /DNA_START=85 /DNA_END=468 /DNA_ORIENTATION=-
MAFVPAASFSLTKSFAGNDVRGFFSSTGLSSVQKPEESQTSFTVENVGTEFLNARKFRISYVLPGKKKGFVRDQSEASFSRCTVTKVIPYYSWFAEQQNIQKMGGIITKVKLFSGNPRWNVGQAGSS